MTRLLAACTVVVALHGAPYAADADAAAGAVGGPGAPVAAADSARELPPAFRRGPLDVSLAGQATLHMPAGFAFLPAEETRAVLREWGNRPSDLTLGMVVPIDDQGAPPWFLVLAYFPAGHVTDDDAGKWDRNAMLAEIRRALDPSNHARSTDGAAETQVAGWVNPPSYDTAAHRLSWSIAIAETKAVEAVGAVSASGLQPGRQQDINFNTVILGRSGYISANLVMPLADYPSFAATVQSIVAAIAFEPGRRYADYDARADARADRSLGALVAANPPARKSWVAQVLAAPREIVLVLAAAAIGVAIGFTTRGRTRYRRSS